MVFFLVMLSDFASVIGLLIAASYLIIKAYLRFISTQAPSHLLPPTFSSIHFQKDLIPIFGARAIEVPYNSTAD